MNRVLIISMILVAMVSAVNAQFFAEGSMGIGLSGGTNSPDGNAKFSASYTYFNVSPKVGCQLNKNTALGLSASHIRKIGRGGTMLSYGDIVEWESKELEWSFAVFNRYKLWGTKKLSFWVESSVYISKIAFESMTEITNRIENERRTGIQALPLISYDLSNRFSIILSCDFLSLNLYSTDMYYLDRDTYRDSYTEIKTRYWTFESAVQSALFDNLSNIRIGIIYHFNKADK